ncbi:hypothetical protein LTR64_007116 [Lithohypha guttulata]|uniref:uncharacterized protein n=1 Tax=Lithohypha guttulata TaxID=1690604 RepID=UPI002DE01D7A|nr:hypothetical protein LTR51_004328 [Lithohypha guttulata]
MNMPSIKPVVLDGSTLEGGGQLVRVALTLSAITGIPVSIHNIRANRAPHGHRSSHQSKRNDVNHNKAKFEGGLKESHLAALKWLAYQCDAYVEGAEVGSRECVFVPGKGSVSARSNRQETTIRQGDNSGSSNFDGNVIELHSPGSVWLILQALLPYLIFGRQQVQSETDTLAQEAYTELVLRGGTNVSKSMSGEYVQQVLLPTLHNIGLPKIDVEVVKRGWAGNAPAIGEVKVRVPQPPPGGFKLPPFEITEWGYIDHISVSIVAGSANARHTLKAELENTIAEHFGRDLMIVFVPGEDSGDSRRLYILLVAHTSTNRVLGRDFLGTGKRPKNATEEVRILQGACQTIVKDLKKEIEGDHCVDEYLQDQLVVFQALASGRNVVDGWSGRDVEQREGHDEECGDTGGSLHTRTIRWVCRKMMSRLQGGVEFEAGGICTGISQG